LVAGAAGSGEGLRNAPHLSPAFAGQTRAPAVESGFRPVVTTLAGGLEHPWGIAPLPDGGYLVTERPGRLRRISAAGEVSDPIVGLPEVFARGQGGLLDVALSPEFARDRVIYWTFAKPMGDDLSATAAARGVLSPDATEVTGVTEIFVQEPPSPTPRHYGSRIVFDAQGHVFITTGEHSSDAERVLSQDLGATYGKVIRLAVDGSVPGDNPFAGREGIDTIWSYGHRNMQGAAIEPGTGRLWTIEHGPRGGDELNRPEAGLNYGWPVITYGINYDGSAIGEGISAAPGLEQPRYFWDPVIAPGGMTFYGGAMFPEWRGDLFIGSMVPGELVRLEIDGESVTGEERLLPGIGRVRDVEEAPDGALLLLIDADDGAVLRVSRE
jgi:glucose/arabinose dehydrogenase